MITSLLRVVATLFALTVILVACASDSGAEWTFAPAVTAATGAVESPSGSTEPAALATDPAESTEPAAAATEAPAQPEATEASAQPATATGDARVIPLEATGALQFTQDGQQIRDIPVTPGETVVFQIDNTAGFPHNFYIGQDSELSPPGATTEVGIPDWDTGVQEIEWVVPDDITDLKFGCTVPGHYTLMQGVFSVDTSAPTETTEEAAETTEAPAETTEEAAETTEAPQDPAPPATAGDTGRVIMLQADGALRFTDAEGEQLRDIPVTPGETVVFQVDNTAGFPHNFYIGQDSELITPGGTTDNGIPDWSTGVQELEWVVPDDITDLKFGCTVPGHYTLMQGVFSEAEGAAPAETASEPEVTAAATESPAQPEATEAPAGSTEPATASGDARVIPLEATGALQFTQDGQQIRDIPVTPGETVVFQIDNTAGFPHNFYIGQDSELSPPGATTEVGIPDWDTGVQEVEWVVPDDITDLKFGCTVPGHYTLMQGVFSADA